MSNNQLQIALPTEEEQLKLKLQDILRSQNLQAQRALLTTLAGEMAVDVLDCGAALLYIIRQVDDAPAFSAHDRVISPLPVPALVDTFSGATANNSRPSADIYKLEPVSSIGYVLPAVKMVRYRLDIGKKHQLTVNELKKVLVEESGVDKNNINNVMIHGQYTLIELPDEMPQDIFQHLKTVEINSQKLNIKRLKTRPKKQAANRFRRSKQRASQRNGDTSD
jgi:hypothetical protein